MLHRARSRMRKRTETEDWEPTIVTACPDCGEVRVGAGSVTAFVDPGPAGAILAGGERERLVERQRAVERGRAGEVAGGGEAGAPAPRGRATSRSATGS